MSTLGPDTIIGIDLGTSNSCAAVAYGDGQVKLIPYKGGESIIPQLDHDRITRFHASPPSPECA